MQGRNRRCSGRNIPKAAARIVCAKEAARESLPSENGLQYIGAQRKRGSALNPPLGQYKAVRRKRRRMRCLLRRPSVHIGTDGARSSPSHSCPTSKAATRAPVDLRPRPSESSAYCCPSNASHHDIFFYNGQSGRVGIATHPVRPSRSPNGPRLRGLRLYVRSGTSGGGEVP